MIAHHHRWLTRVACTDRQSVEIDRRVYLVEDLLDLSVAPDRWEELHLDLLLGHKRASSFLHFGVRYCLSRDYSLCYDTSGRIFRDAAKHMVVEISPRLGRVFWSANIFKGEEEGWPKEPKLRDFVFPTWKETVQGMEAWEDDWSDEERFSFQLHMCQDKEVPHHCAGFLYDGHVPDENFLWEVLEEGGIKTEEDLEEALEYHQRWYLKGGAGTETGRRWQALNISKRALANTKRLLFPEESHP